MILHHNVVYCYVNLPLGFVFGPSSLHIPPVVAFARKNCVTQAGCLGQKFKCGINVFIKNGKTRFA